MRENSSLAVLAALAGVVVGFGGVVLSFYLTIVLHTQLLSFHPTIVQGENIFPFSIGQDFAYFTTLAGLALGMFAVTKAKMLPAIRAFLIGVALPLLGFWALCSFLGVLDLFQKHQ